MAENKKGPGRPKGTKTLSKAELKALEIQEREKKDKRVVDEIWAVIIIAIGIFLTLSVFSSGAGRLGVVFCNGLRGLFGPFGSRVIPIYFIVFGILLIAKQTVHFSFKTFLLLFISLLMISTIASIKYSDESFVWSYEAVNNFYSTGLEGKSGGYFGMILSTALIQWLGKTGCWIFVIVVIIICISLILNTPISRFFASIHDNIEKRRLVKENEHLNVENDPQLNMNLNNIDKINNSNHKINIIGAENVDENIDEKKIVTREIVPLTEEKKNNILKFMSDDNLFGETKKSGSYGLEEINERKEGYGIDGDSFNSHSKSIGLETKIEENNIDFTQVNYNNTEHLKVYKLPPTTLLNKPQRGNGASSKKLESIARRLEETLASFNVNASVVNVTQGPTVTRYEVKPSVGVKISSIENLADDIALNLEAKSIRIEAPIPGKAAVGIEVDNENRTTVSFREVIESPEFKNSKSKLSIALGKEISGKPIIADISKMPHLLVAGTTGSGKSVLLNCIICSLMYKATPDEVKLILVDPKRGAEFGRYKSIPYLRSPIVSDTKQAIAALNWAVAEMEDRYNNLAQVGAKDFDSYNEIMRSINPDNVIPRIVIIFDEFADLMLSEAKVQLENAVQKIAAKARAAGMHLILATQKPLVKVINNVIQGNIPVKIALTVANSNDSRIIIDKSGAEKLLGHGDMLFKSEGSITRIQSPYIDDTEIDKIVEYSKKQSDFNPEELENFKFENVETNFQQGIDNEDDELLAEVINYVVQAKEASTSMIQRRFRIGYNRAARIMDVLEEKGIVGPADGSRKRIVLITNEQLEEMEENE